MNSNRLYHRLFCAAALCAVTILGLSPSANATIYRVDGRNGSCSGDGSDWGSDAFKYLQDAIDEADGLGGGDEIWVAAGTYRVDQRCSDTDGSGERDEAFLLKEGVKLRGGFAGDEEFATDRELDENLTILSGVLNRPLPTCGTGSCFEGEINDPPGCNDSLCCSIVCDTDPYCCETEWDDGCAFKAKDKCGEAYHVVTAGSAIDDPETTFIERFTIQDGVANGPGLHEDKGGGMLVLVVSQASYAASSPKTMQLNKVVELVSSVSRQKLYS